MELKRIIARDTRSANEKAIQMYGQDVLIISSHKVDNQIELVVAVETAPAAPMSAPVNDFKPLAVLPSDESSRATPAPSGPAFSRVFEEHMVSPADKPPADASQAAEHDMVMDALTALSRRVVSQPSAVPVTSSAPTSESQPVEPVTASAPTAQAAPVMSAEPVVPAALAPSEAVHDFRRSQETVELLRQEMAALRQEFALSRQMAVWQGGLGLTPEIDQLWNQLLELGMPARLRSLLLDSVRNLQSVEEARGMVFQLLSGALKRPVAAVPQQGVHALCGPSGAGKTLMVVRLAKQAGLGLDPEQQAIISYCDQRPGAWSQLQVLAAQTGIECYKAGDAQTLKLLLDDLSSRKAIWIDTPGTDFLSHAQALHAAVPGAQLHAVLPVDATVTSVQKVLETSSMPWSSLMLSKFDEAAHPWPLIQGLCNSTLRVSLVSQGALLSQPSTGFDPEQLTEMALSPLGTMTMVTPKKKASRKRVSPLESTPKEVVKRSRSTAKVLNA
jgi:flagellar biosynthesis protein FlhF